MFRDFLRFIVLVAAVDALVLVVAGILYFLFWPIPVTPAEWNPAEAPELTGRYQTNTALEEADYLLEGVVHGPEDVAIDSEGRIYAGSEGGNIYRYTPATGLIEVYAHTGGRPLGLDFDANENLIVADAMKGLLSVDRGGKVKVLVNEHAGSALNFVDDVDVAPSGNIYFTDASSKFGYDEVFEDVIEHLPHGRVFVYDPMTESARMILGDLFFANGIAVSPDESFVLVNETTAYRVRKIWLSGSDAGRANVLIDNLPGFPDGISSNGEGVYWIAIYAPRSEALDWLAARRTLRAAMYRLPESLRPQEQDYGFVLGIDGAGSVIHNLQGPSGNYAPITSVEQFGDTLYLGSLTARAIGTVPAP